jgi:hypothetical protein
MRRLASLLVFVAVVGCGPAAPKTVTLKGKVTIDGQNPPAGTSISLLASDGTANGGGGSVTDGAYAINVPPGKYKVQIRAPKPPAAGSKQMGLTGDMFAEMLPAKYNDATELTVDVAEGGSEKNFELSTKK